MQDLSMVAGLLGARVLRPLPHDIGIGGAGPSLLPHVPINSDDPALQAQIALSQFGQRFGLDAFGRWLLPRLYRKSIRAIRKIRHNVGFEYNGEIEVKHATGVCTDPVVRNGDVVFLDGEPVQVGDLAFLNIKGDPLPRGKAFAGTCGPRDFTRRLYGGQEGPFAVFYCWAPKILIPVPVADLASLRRVRAIRRGGVLQNIDRAEVLDRLRDLESLDLRRGELAPV